MFNFRRNSQEPVTSALSGPSKETQDYLQLFERIADRSHREVDWVRSAYKWLAGLVAVIALAGMGFTYKSVSDLKADFEKYERDLSDRLDRDTKTKLTDVQENVIKQINKEFDSDNIRALVEKQAQEKIKQIADALIQSKVDELVKKKAAEIDERVTTFNKQLSLSVQHVQEAAYESSVTANKTIEVGHLLQMLFSATQGSRKDFDQAMKQDDDPVYGDLIRRTLSDIAVKLDAGELFPIGYAIDWGNYKVDPKKATMDELIDVFGKSPIPIQRQILSEIWAQDRFPKYERLKFLADVIETNHSLEAVARAERLMDDEAHLKKNILGCREYLTWWKDHAKGYQSAATSGTSVASGTSVIR